jgi:type I restriction enzyme M protein
MPDHSYFANLIWQIADLLRGPYRPPQYERVMLPMTVLRRFDCVLAPTKAKVLAERQKLKGGKIEGEALDRRLDKIAGQRFHNHSPLDFEKLKGDPDNIGKHLVSYIKGFSTPVRRIFDFFEFENEIEKMGEANTLFLVVTKFSDVDLHPDKVPNAQMGLIFENLIRRFNELANETAGDHFTPREVIRLMVNLLFIHDDKLLATPGTVRKLLDPACGTGGMLAEAQNYLREHHPAARLYAYGQDYNKRAYATAASDMLMKQVDHNGSGDNVRFGDSFTEDRFEGETFDYFLTNPPFGVDWKKQQREIQREHDSRGYDGRFGAGLPRVNDGSLLFLQHMISKFEPVRPAEQKHGSRLAIVFSGSPLFTGGAGSGESDIRKWIIENDWLEGIIALPEQMFYNTGIGTYVWIVTNRKEKRRKGKIQLVDVRELYVPMRRSLGDKRRKIGEKEDGRDQIAEIVKLYGRFADGETSKIFDNADFGYTRVTVERPLRLRYQMTTEDKVRFLDACPHLLNDVQSLDRGLGREPQRDWNAVWARIEGLLHKRKSSWKASEEKLFRGVFTQKDPEAEPVHKGKGCESDAELRDFENVPLKEDVEAYFEREVQPHAPDA